MTMPTAKHTIKAAALPLFLHHELNELVIWRSTCQQRDPVTWIGATHNQYARHRPDQPP